MNFEYTPAPEESGEAGFVGSAIIEGTHPFVASVDQVKYLGEDDDSGHAMSYMVTGDLANVELLALPLVQRGVFETGMGDTTGIQLFNPTEGSVVLVIWLFDQYGDTLPNFPVLVSLDAKEGHTFYVMQKEVQDGFQGSAIIEVLSGAEGGVVVAASNNVNYAAQFDGSAAFNLVPVGPHQMAVGGT
jgi:hypothetical protein